MFERHALGLKFRSEHYLAEFVDARDPGMVVSIMKLEGDFRISYPIKETVPVLQLPNIKCQITGQNTLKSNQPVQPLLERVTGQPGEAEAVQVRRLNIFGIPQADAWVATIPNASSQKFISLILETRVEDA